MNILRIPYLQNLFWSRHWLSEHYYRLPFSGKLSKFKKASLLRDVQPGGGGGVLPHIWAI